MDTIIDAIREKAIQGAVPELTMRTFLRNVETVREGGGGYIRESEIESVGSLPRMEELPGDHPDMAKRLSEMVVIKLNGGLGTGMGLEGPKSLLRAKGDFNFLDLIVKQVLYHRKGGAVSCPALYFMNSFSTQAATLDYLQRHPELIDSQSSVDFLQGRVPKLYADTLLPATWESDPDLEWCPPGHGDIYAALQGNSGLLDRLLDQGLRYAFISNSDNLGATISPALLAHFATSGAAFMMEVARKTDSDKKGGHLARQKSNGRLVLRESAQCHDDDREAFGDASRYPYFNTNNLWLNLVKLKETFEAHDGVLPLHVIANQKHLDPRDGSSPKVIQIETAMGAAINLFADSIAVEVPRTRFAPVKTTADLLNLWSNAYEIVDDYSLRLVESRNGIPPVVLLDSNYFKFESDFTERFPVDVPCLTRCDRFEVKGDLVFEGNVTCIGDVCFENQSSTRKIVPAGEYQDKTLTL